MKSAYLTAVFDPRTLLRCPLTVVYVRACKASLNASQEAQAEVNDGIKTSVPSGPAHSLRHFKADAAGIWALRVMRSRGPTRN